MGRLERIKEAKIGKTFAEILKFNPYHDAKGRFSNANGYTSFTYAPGKSKAHDMAIAREKERQAGAAAGTQTKHRDEEELEGDAAIAAIMQDTGVSKDVAADMQRAVMDYSSISYTEIRSYQINGKPPTSKKQAEDLEAFIQASPKWDGGEVYRGMAVKSEVGMEIVRKAQQGLTIGQQGSSSWTTDRATADEFAGRSADQNLTRIIFKSSGQQNGTSIKHLSIFPDEKEVLMSTNARWKPTKVTKVGNNKWEIECSPIPADVEPVPLF